MMTVILYLLFYFAIATECNHNHISLIEFPRLVASRISNITSWFIHISDTSRFLLQLEHFPLLDCYLLKIMLCYVMEYLLFMVASRYCQTFYLYSLETTEDICFQKHTNVVILPTFVYEFLRYF